MPSIHTFLQIFIVLDGGKRRGSWVRRALVSRPYPYFYKENLEAILSVQDVVAQKVGKTVVESESLGASRVVIDASLTNLVKEVFEEDSLLAGVVVADVVIDALAVSPIPEGISELLGSNLTVIQVDIIPLAVSSTTVESLNSQRNVVDVYLGEE